MSSQGEDQSQGSVRPPSQSRRPGDRVIRSLVDLFLDQISTRSAAEASLLHRRVKRLILEEWSDQRRQVFVKEGQICAAMFEFL